MIAGWVNDASNIAGGGGRVRRDGRTRRAAQVTQLTLTPRARLLSVCSQGARTDTTEIY